LSDSEIPQVENHAHTLLKITLTPSRDFQLAIAGAKSKN